MKTRKFLKTIGLGLVCALALGQCCAFAQESTDSEISAHEMVESMTLREKVTQMIMPAAVKWSDTPEDETSFESITALNSELEQFFRDNNFAGVCLFADNCKDTEQMIRLIDQLQTAASQTSTGIPMFFTVDQEGGVITRLKTGTSGVGNMALTATGDSENARLEAEMIGSELSAIGFNVDFAPDVDVNNNPNNPVIGVRSFSDDPETVSEYAEQFILGLHSTGTLTCIKHFPGHGDTAVDSHTGLPLIEKTYDEMKELELIPFTALVDKTDMVMVAHIQYPNVETGTYTSIDTGETIGIPSSLSKTIVSDILRGDLGFDGIVVTDALNMDAIAKNFDQLDAAKLAINAGVDILLMPWNISDTSVIDKYNEYTDGIVDMVNAGEIDEREIDDSVERILQAKIDCGLFEKDERSVEEQTAEALSVVGSKEHHDLEWKMAMEAVTLAAGDAASVPAVTDDTNVLVLSPLDSLVNSVSFAAQKLVEDGVIKDSSKITGLSYDGINADNFSEIEATVNGSMETADEVILITKVNAYSETDTSVETNYAARLIADSLAAAKEQGKTVVVISSRLPYDANCYPEADAVYLAYNSTGMTDIPEDYSGHTVKYGPNVPAALVTVLEGITPSGTCPVSIPE